MLDSYRGVYTVDELVQAVGGRLIRKKAADFFGISLDSREKQNEKAFFCLKGERTDGHCFAGQAVQNGATVVIVEEARPSIPIECNNVSIVGVENSFEAMRSFAAYCRTRLTCPIVGVTGSNGKTTTKEMIASIMKCAAGGSNRVLKNEENKNTDFGMALSLGEALPTHHYCVLEMAMRGLGQIKRLAEVALPDIGVITNIGPAHLEFLGSLDNIAKAKGELFEMLPANGSAIYPDDEIQRLGKIASHIPIENHWTFGSSSRARARILRAQSQAFKSRVSLQVGSRIVDVEIPLLGNHNIKNAACAVAVSYALNIPENFIRKGLAELSLPGQRSDVYSLNGRWIIDDCYNANPASMRAALEVLSQSAGARKGFAVLGDMLELGQESARYHLEIGRYAAAIGIQGIVCVGELAQLIAQGAKEAGCPKIYDCRKPEDAAEVVSRWMNEGDRVLFKGSRGIQMERAVSTLKALWSVQKSNEITEKKRGCGNQVFGPVSD